MKHIVFDGGMGGPLVLVTEAESNTQWPRRRPERPQEVAVIHFYCISTLGMNNFTLDKIEK